MAKKKLSADTGNKQVLFRVDESEYEALEAVALLETGERSVPGWARRICKLRREKVEQAVKSGKVKYVNGCVVLTEELEDSPAKR